MKLFDILMRHAAPKSQVEFVLKRVLADSEEHILAKVDKDLAYGCWTDRSNEDGLLDIFNDETYEVIGTETYLEKMLRLRGEFNDGDASFDDAYYGIKHYGWSEGREVSPEEVAVLERLGLIEDWRA